MAEKKVETLRDRIERLKEFAKAINKEVGKGVLGLASELKYPPVSRIPTGVFSWDFALGGGMPASRVSEIWGTKSSCKTTLALKLVASAQRICFNCFKPDCRCGKRRECVASWIDAEGCVAGTNEMINPLTGEIKEVREWFEDDDGCFAQVFDGRKVVVENINRKVNSGFLNTIKINTVSSGISVTENHRLLVWRDGSPKWVESGDIRVGDFIGRPWKKEFNVGDGKGFEEGYLLGLLLGDGCLRENGSIEFAGKDESVIKKLKILANKFNNELVRLDDRHWRIRENGLSRSEYRWGRGNSLRRWLRGFGLIGLKSHDKIIPKEFFEMGNRALLGIVGGLFMTDGTVNGIRPSVSIGLTSRKLIFQVREILSRYGILGRLNIEDYHGKYRPNYKLTINGYENLVKFRETVELVGHKMNSLDYWCLNKSRKQNHLSKENFFPGYNNAKYYKNREKFINDSDVYWDKVVDIRKNGVEECFDFGVRGHHNLAINDIFVHNCWDDNWADAQGVDKGRLLLSRPETAEEAVDVMVGILQTGDVDLIVFDSLAALSPKTELEDSTEKWQQGLSARIFNKGWRKIAGVLNRISREGRPIPTVVFINQQRFKIGVMFGNPETKPGGMGQEFITSTETKTYGGKYEMDSDTGKPLWVEFSFRIEKNKTAPARIEGSFKMSLTDTEARKMGSLIEEDQIFDLGLRFGMIKKVDDNDYRIGDLKFKKKDEIKKKWLADRDMFGQFKASLLGVMTKI